MVDYGADDAAIAHPAHAGKLFLEVFPAEAPTQSRVGGDEAVGEAVVAGDVDNRAGLGNAADGGGPCGEAYWWEGPFQSFPRLWR